MPCAMLYYKPEALIQRAETGCHFLAKTAYSNPWLLSAWEVCTSAKEAHLPASAFAPP